MVDGGGVRGPWTRRGSRVVMGLSAVREWFGYGRVLLFVLVPLLLVPPMAVHSHTVVDGGSGRLLVLEVPSGTVGTTDEIASELAGPPAVDPGEVLALAAVERIESHDDADGERGQDVIPQVGEGTISTAGDLAVSAGRTIELQSITGSLIVPFEEEGWGRVATFVASSAEDRDSMNWSLSGTDALHFSIDSPGGALRFHIDPVSPTAFPNHRTTRTLPMPTRTTPTRSPWRRPKALARSLLIS